METEHIIRTIVDNTGFKEYITRVSEVEAKSRQMADGLAKDAKLLDVSWTNAFTKAGKEFTNATAIFQNGAEVVKVSFREMGNEIVANSIKVHTAMNRALLTDKNIKPTQMADLEGLKANAGNIVKSLSAGQISPTAEVTGQKTAFTTDAVGNAVARTTVEFDNLGKKTTAVLETTTEKMQVLSITTKDMANATAVASKELNKLNLQSVTLKLDEAQKASNYFASTLTKDSKLMSTSMKESFDSMGNKVIRTTSVFDTFGNKTKVVFDTTSEGMKKVSETSDTLDESLKKHPKTLAEATTGFAKLAARSIVVIPIWMLLRNSIMSMIKVTKESIKFLIDWEYQMAQIKMVSGESATAIMSLSTSLLSLATNLGMNNKELANGAILWIQQGRSISEVIPLMGAVAKLSMLTGRTIVQSVEDLTSVLKSYNLEAKDSISIVDSIIQVEQRHAITAADLTAAYRQSASTAASLGVSLNNLAGYITAIQTVTRDSGNTVGLTLRTMFSRITTTSATAIESLTGIPLFLDSMGNPTKTATANFRNLDTVLTELANKFKELGTAEKSQLASLVGGVRRQNQVIALFNNFTEAIDANIDSLFSLGKADASIGILTDTTKIRIEKLTNAWGQFVQAVGDTGAIKTGIGAIGAMIEGISSTINPEAFIFGKVSENVQKSLDEFARKNKLADSFVAARNRAMELTEAVKSGRVSESEAEAEILKWVTAINKAGKTVDFQLNDKIKTSADLAKDLNDQMSQIKKIKIEADISYSTTSLKSQLLENTNQIKTIFKNQFSDLDKVIKLPKGLLSKTVTFDLKTSGKELKNMESALQSSVKPEVYSEIVTLINERLKIEKQVNDVTIRRSEIEAKVTKEIEDSNKTVIKNNISEAQIKERLLLLELHGLRTNRDKLEVINAQIATLERRKTGLSAEYQNNLDNLKIEKTKLEISRQHETRLSNQTKVLSQLKARGATTLQLAIQELAFANKYNKTFEERAKLQEKVNSLKMDTEVQTVNTLIDTQADLLRMQGLQDYAIIKQTMDLEKKLNIDKKGLDLLKQQLTYIKAITAENKKSKEERLSALEAEINEQSKLQNPAYQEMQKIKEDMLKERAKELKIDTDKFLKPAELSPELDLPSELKNLADSPSLLTSAIENLTKEIMIQETKSLPITGTQRALAGNNGVDTNKKWNEAIALNKLQATNPRNSSGQFLPEIPSMPKMEITMGDIRLNLTGYLTPEELESKLDELSKQNTEKVITEYNKRLENTASHESSLVRKHIYNY
jgi:TP901 family phage tail tape measure protein